jgi:hypothetical protein
MRDDIGRFGVVRRGAPGTTDRDETCIRDDASAWRLVDEALAQEVRLEDFLDRVFALRAAASVFSPTARPSASAK